MLNSLDAITLLFLASWVGTIVLGVVLAAVVTSYQRVLKKMKFTDVSAERAQELLEDAAKKLVRAHEQAQQILGEAQKTDVVMDARLGKELEVASADVLAGYQDMLQNLLAEARTTFTHTLSIMDQDLKQNLREAHETVQKDLGEMVNDLEREYHERLTTMQQHELDRIKTESSAIVDQVAARFFREHLTAQQQEAVTELAIEEAIRAGVVVPAEKPASAVAPKPSVQKALVEKPTAPLVTQPQPSVRSASTPLSELERILATVRKPGSARSAM